LGFASTWITNIDISRPQRIKNVAEKKIKTDRNVFEELKKNSNH
jgi:hypothetical protein